MRNPTMLIAALGLAVSLTACGSDEPDPYEAILDTNPSEFYENYTPPGQELSPEREMLSMIWDLTEYQQGELVYLCLGYEDDPYLAIGMLAVELEADPTDVKWLLEEKC